MPSHVKMYCGRVVVLAAAVSSMSGALGLKSPAVALRAHASSSRAAAVSSVREEPSFGELFKFTLTAMPIFVAPTLLSLIDTAFVGRLSTDLAAMGPACAVVDSVSGLFVFVSVGATNAAAKAASVEEARRSATIGVGIGAALGVVVGSMMLACGPSTFQSLPLARQCSDYVRIRAFSMPAVVALMSAQASCLGAKDSASPARATLLASLVNVAGDALLVPSRGVAGAAWATVACQYVAALACVKALASKGMITKIFSRPTAKEIKNFFAFGPFMIVLVCKMITYNQAVLLAAALGSASSAAHQIVYSLSRFCFTLGDSTGATAQSYLPTYPRIARKIVAVSAAVAVVASSLTLAAPSSLFTKDAAVAHLMRHVAPAAALGLLMHPIVVGLEGCLLARKDLGWLVRNYCATAFASVLATSCFLKFISFSLLDVWLYLAAYQALRFATFLTRVAL